MAIRSTVHKADLSIADMDRHHYADHSLTLARHPSETEERLMVRLVAFAMHADERLTPAGGISTEDEPDFWHLDDTGSIRLWLQVGLPDERLLRKASGRSDEVVLYAYGGRKAEAWRQDNAAALARLSKLTIWYLPEDECEALLPLVERTMRLGATIQDGHLLLAGDKASVELTPQLWQRGQAG
ncbi:MAG: YaeQ family protein [Sphaerotilus sulfidivorans]|jgi:uncharacterized protein YaeQ|uniref:YaeQ family protein n=1 Tax=Sphaerotilus sulfidivorans TaxID=639200 RepID=UPI003F3401A4